MKEKVSVVIPVYNRRELVKRALDSVYAQDYRPLRVIVVDNGSTDGTSDAVREWGERMDAFLPDSSFELVLTSEDTPGAAAARNRGLALVDTRMVSFFDSDDEMLPTLISDAMEASEGADVVTWRVAVDHGEKGCVEKPFYCSDLFRRQMYNAIFSTQTFLADAGFIRRIGGWDSRAMVWNDWELGLRMALAAPRVSLVDRVLVRVYPQKESITGTAFHHKIGKWENTLSIVEGKCMDADEETFPDGFTKGDILDMLDYRRAILAAAYRREGSRREGKALLREALSSRRLGWRRRAWLRLLHLYTAAGGRGAYYLWV